MIDLSDGREWPSVLVSSGDARRHLNGTEYARFRELISDKVISVEVKRLTVEGDVSAQVFHAAAEFCRDWQDGDRWLAPEMAMAECAPSFLPMTIYGGDAHQTLAHCAQAWLLDRGHSVKGEVCLYDIWVDDGAIVIEVGDCPSVGKLYGPLRSPGVEWTGLIPFQDDSESMRGSFDPYTIDMLMFGRGENFDPERLLIIPEMVFPDIFALRY